MKKLRPGKVKSSVSGAEGEIVKWFFRGDELSFPSAKNLTEKREGSLCGVSR